MDLPILSFRKDLDCTLVSQEGKVIGEIEDWIVDQQTGEVVAGLAGIGGFLGLGERHTLLPAEILRFEDARHRYVLVGDPDRLGNAPRFVHTDLGHLDAHMLDASRSYFQLT